jgi:hypothetical protein
MYIDYNAYPSGSSSAYTLRTATHALHKLSNRKPYYELERTCSPPSEPGPWNLTDCNLALGLFICGRATFVPTWSSECGMDKWRTFTTLTHD